MSTETAARYLSLDERSFLQLAGTFDLPCVHIDELSARWRKLDLDHLIKRLPSESAQQATNLPQRLAWLDDTQIEAIAAAVAKQLGRHVARSESKLVSISDATAILGVGRSTIYKMITEGGLKTRRIGRRTLIPRSDLDAILAGRAEN